MKYSSQKRVNSEEFPEVVFILRKMTEGRRIELRSKMMAPQKRVREIMRQQSELDAQLKKGFDTDPEFDAIVLTTKYNDLQDEFDEIMISEINPIWLLWGLKAIEGLQVDDKSLSVEDWKDWPSGLVQEAVAAVRAEAELEGLERKNSQSPTISGEPVGGNQNNSTATPANEKAGGETGTVVSISKST